MTIIGEKLLELKSLSARGFGTTVEKMDGASRRREVSDARKCVALLARELYPEVNGSAVARLMRKERSSTRRLLSQGRNLAQSDRKFRAKVDLVRAQVKKPACHYCGAAIGQP